MLVLFILHNDKLFSSYVQMYVDSINGKFSPSSLYFILCILIFPFSSFNSNENENWKLKENQRGGGGRGEN